jgi:ABC-type multidrug transport system fused ATPase/permease subunit
VTVGGIDVRDLLQRDLRSLIAVVPQDVYLFHASVADNLRLGNPDATDDEVRRAAGLAQATSFIELLPDGFDTVLGERGASISGGQRQRLAIARALLADPRILILDDATSSVDASTEQEIKAALEEVMRGRTTFVIAHRLSTISMAQEIVVMERGRIVARGDHEALLDVSPLYREIVEKGTPEAVFLTRKPLEPQAAGL